MIIVSTVTLQLLGYQYHTGMGQCLTTFPAWAYQNVPRAALIYLWSHHRWHQLAGLTPCQLLLTHQFNKMLVGSIGLLNKANELFRSSALQK